MLLIALPQRLLMVSIREKKIFFLSLIRFVPLDQIPKIKICHMVTSEHPEVIEGRRRLITADVFESEEAAEYGSIDNDGAASDEEEESGSGEVGVRTGVTQSGIEEAGEVQRVVEYYSLLSYMLKPPSLITRGFNKNKKANEKLFNHMCNFGAQEYWRNGRRYVSSYLDVDIRNDQERLVNTTPLDRITGYTMEDAIVDRALKRLPQ